MKKGGNTRDDPRPLTKGEVFLFPSKPFMLIAGFYDNMASFDTMQQARSYAQAPENLVILNHATGHRPPQEELHAGYRFLEKYLK